MSNETSPWIAAADQEPQFDVTVVITDGYRYEFARYVGGDASPWISVADRLPPDLAQVLIWGPYRYQIDTVFNGQLGYGATHWTYLPDPPKDAA